MEDATAVNIGTSEHIKVIDTAKQIFKETGFSPESISYDTSKPVGVYSRAADLTRTREVLNWEPMTSFEEGLRRTIEWYNATHDETEVASKLGLLLTER